MRGACASGWRSESRKSEEFGEHEERVERRGRGEQREEQQVGRSSGRGEQIIMRRNKIGNESMIGSSVEVRERAGRRAERSESRLVTMTSGENGAGMGKLMADVQKRKITKVLRHSHAPGRSLQSA